MGPNKRWRRSARNVPAAADLAIEDINPLNAHLFRENRWQDHFARLRAEDPVHFNELETAGRYWSLTKYDDVRAVDGDWKTFSSERLGSPWAQRSTTRSTTAPPLHVVHLNGSARPDRATQHGPFGGRAQELAQSSNRLIRERTAQILDSLPDGETFDWVDSVSVELTTMMLATLFDFPWEDRGKLTYWSDLVFAIPQPGAAWSRRWSRSATR